MQSTWHCAGYITEVWNVLHPSLFFPSLGWTALLHFHFAHEEDERPKNGNGDMDISNSHDRLILRKMARDSWRQILNYILWPWTSYQKKFSHGLHRVSLATRYSHAPTVLLFRVRNEQSVGGTWRSSQKEIMCIAGQPLIKKQGIQFCFCLFHLPCSNPRWWPQGQSPGSQEETREQKCVDRTANHQNQDFQNSKSPGKWSAKKCSLLRGIWATLHGHLQYLLVHQRESATKQFSF